MSYDKTEFVEGGAPGISATELNKIGTGIEDAHTNAASAQNSADSAQAAADSAQSTANGAQSSADAAQSAADAAQTAADAAQSTANGKISKAILIPVNADLNDYDGEGEFYCPANATVATLLNCPTQEAFYMKVGRHAGVNQTITDFGPTDDFRIFTRNFYSGSWGPWREVIVTVNSSNIEWILQRHIIIQQGKDIVLQAASGTDSGDVIYRDAAGNEIGRVWATNGDVWVRGGPTGGGAIWNTEKLRVSGGALQFLDGGVWKGAGGVKSVQRGTASIPSGSSDVNVTINVVNMGKTMVNPLSMPFSASGSNWWDLELTSSTNLHIHAPAGETINFEVIEFY